MIIHRFRFAMFLALILLLGLIDALPAHPILIRKIAYDAESNPIQISTADGNYRRYEYDACDRISKVMYSDDHTVCYTYDQSGRLTVVNDAHGITRFFYHECGYLEGVEYPGSVHLKFNYDVTGRLLQIIGPGNDTVTYKYDERGRIWKVSDIYGSLATYEYDNNTNLLIGEKLAFGIKTYYSYDSSNRILSARYEDSSGKEFDSFSYEYDNNGNCTKITRVIYGEKQFNTSYEYDSQNQLIRENRENVQDDRYAYDVMGNRISKKTFIKNQPALTEYKYDKQGRLIQANDTIYDYDVLGNLIEKRNAAGSTKYYYNSALQLTRVDTNKDSIEFEYDGLGNRVSKSVNGVKTRFINFPLGVASLPLAELDNEGNLIRTLRYGICRLGEMGTDEYSIFIHSQLGMNLSSVATTPLQFGIQPFFYDAFGMAQSDCTNVETNYGFAGEQFDKETGLIFLRNRYYDPEIGRFISRDPEGGSIMSAVSQNLYLYAENNPVSRIDPLGLHFLICKSYPPQVNGVKSPGHAWVQLHDDDGNLLGCYGAYALWQQDSISRAKNSQVIDVDAFASYKAVTTTAFYLDKGRCQSLKNQLDTMTLPGNFSYDLHHNNCVALVSRALDLAGIPHPDFRDELAFYQPYMMCTWAKMLNLGYSNRDMFSLYQRLSSFDEASVFRHSEVGSMASLAIASKKSYSGIQLPKFGYLRNRFLDYGGVTLDKTAELSINLNDVEGATYDTVTGQIILFGRKKIYLPTLNFDDLAVAIKSVYGLHNQAPEDPGINIDQSNNAQCAVHYFGQTVDTHFGAIMFESDRLLKCLVGGVDNITGQTFGCSVPNFKSYTELNGTLGGWSSTPVRFWFAPKNIVLAKSEDGQSMVFQEASMQVLTETIKKGKRSIHNKAADIFAQHFTDHYDQFALEFEVLNDLKALAKTTAIVKWIHDKRIPLDLGQFANYQPVYWPTPRTTPSKAWCHVNGGTLTLSSGGVSYILDDTNFSTIANPQAEQIARDAQAARNNEEEFQWDFISSDLKGQFHEYTAVATPVSATRKDGGYTRVDSDIVVPVSGAVPLRLTRYYNSFHDSDKDGLGRGWSVTPASFRYSETPLSYEVENVIRTVFTSAVVRIGSHDTEFQFRGFDSEQNAIYSPDNSVTKIFCCRKSGECILTIGTLHLEFNDHGQLIRVNCSNNDYTEYSYLGNYLTTIKHAQGKCITLEYCNGRLLSATGPQDTRVSYIMNIDNNLDCVNINGERKMYFYDDHHRLCGLTDSREHESFRLAYDSYDRVIRSSNGESSKTHVYDIAKRISKTITDSGEETVQFDDQHRVINHVDVLGNETRFEYFINNDSPNPNRITDRLGRITEYEYDDYGNLTCQSDALGNKWRLFYDSQHRVIAKFAPDNIGECYLFENDRLIQIMHYAVLEETQDGANIQPNVKFALPFVTSFEYSEEGRIPTSVIDGTGIRSNFSFNNEGLFEKSDLNGYCCRHDELGRMLTKTTGKASINYAYNSLNKLAEVNTNNVNMQFEYDLRGNLTSMKDCNDNWSHFSFDDTDRLVTIQDGLGTALLIEYNKYGLVEKIVLPNGKVRQFEYDALQRLEKEWEDYEEELAG